MPKQKLQNQRRHLSEQCPKLVRHRKRNKLGILLERSEIQTDFYFVMTEGSLEEWHISNIDEKV